MVLAELGRMVNGLPTDLDAASKDGRILREIMRRFLELEKSGIMWWLLQFKGFKERLLADDLFLAKVGTEYGVGIITKVTLLFFIKK